MAIGSPGVGEAVSHTDMSYLEDPPKASMLYAIEVPPNEGNAGFTTMCRACDELPDALRRRIAGLRVEHDETYHSGGCVREGGTASAAAIASCSLQAAPAAIAAWHSSGRIAQWRRSTSLLRMAMTMLERLA